MGYELQGVIGRVELLGRYASGVGVIAGLSQGFAVLPMTNEVFDALHHGATSQFLGFWGLPGGFEQTLAEWSAGGPLAYVEAEYFGGTGEQRAAVWLDGAVPTTSVTQGHPRQEPGSPISLALRQLGVARGRHFDEFDAVGLGRCRHTRDWAGG